MSMELLKYPIGKFVFPVKQERNKVQKREQNQEWPVRAERTFEVASLYEFRFQISN